jgi:hypothetical protein
MTRDFVQADSNKWSYCEAAEKGMKAFTNVKPAVHKKGFAKNDEDLMKLTSRC